MGTLSYEVKGPVGVLTIQSPPANALSSNLLNDLEERLDEIETDSSMKAVVLKGEGKFFSAGADIKEFTSLQNASDYQALSEKGQQLFDRIEHFPIPVIAAVHGAALGGGLELAMACHIRIVTKSAKLGLPEVTLGIIPGFAGTQRLPHYVGTAKAYEMILSGQPISGEEAKAAGLANQTVKDEAAFETAFELAEAIAAKSRLSINAVMKLVPHAKSVQFAKGIQEEAKAFARIFGSEDAKEGVQAFIEKRQPNFRDQ
ncbi:short chain enoyl-CoA hydratase [Lentibacillus halodurans]|uniref:Short chain enoyl-CoA hydratase n=1 Tax=Lentibacillus halodurans TaxID=237679 RepID=A0A1I0ZIS4_9BACI|nr:enoyl-CoA hydratase [Lentibacillus halodurans]SFB24308.1 short chain enoyl-CoA hydratase [Lentibacillus halodurans]